MIFDVDFQVVRQLQRTKIRQLRMGDEDVDFVNKEAWSEAIGHINQMIELRILNVLILQGVGFAIRGKWFNFYSIIIV